jgi:hypothetical protein
MQLAWVVPPVSRRVRLKTNSECTRDCSKAPRVSYSWGFCFGCFGQLDIFTPSLLRSAPNYTSAEPLLSSVDSCEY